jgi:hypothetical protein
LRNNEELDLNNLLDPIANKFKQPQDLITIGQGLSFPTMVAALGGASTVGKSSKPAREDHVHDTSNISGPFAGIVNPVLQPGWTGSISLVRISKNSIHAKINLQRTSGGNVIISLNMPSMPQVFIPCGHRTSGGALYSAPNFLVHSAGTLYIYGGNVAGDLFETVYVIHE